MTKHLLLAIAVATCSVFGQEAKPAPAEGPKAAPAAYKHDNSSKKANKPRRGQRNGQHQINPGMMLLGQQAIMEKYDADKDNKLSEAEMTVLKDELKKKHEARKNDFMKKYDKDSDGKLSADEKKAMREEWLKNHPEQAKKIEEMKQKMEAKKAEVLKKFDKDADGKLSDDEKKAMREEWAKEHPRAAKRMQGDRGPRGARGPRGPQKACPMMGGPKCPKHGAKAPRGPQKACPMMGGPKCPKHGAKGPRHHRQAPRPHIMNPAQTPMMMAGMMLLSEKYDADKNGMLNKEEMKQLKADADKLWEAKKAERKAAREAKKAQKAAEQNKPAEPAKA